MRIGFEGNDWRRGDPGEGGEDAGEDGLLHGRPPQRA